MRKSTTFNLDAELAKAWAWCWNYYCTPTEYESRKFPPRQQWLTATDLERRVRAQAAEQLDGADHGADAWGSRVQIRGLNGLTLLDYVRRWLASQVGQGVLRYDHPGGRHTSTGMRYRPVNVGLTEAEQRARDLPIEEKRRQRHIVHLQAPGVKEAGYGRGKPACCVNNPPRQAMYRRPKMTFCTDDAAKITCKRCAKIAAKAQADPRDGSGVEGRQDDREPTTYVASQPGACPGYAGGEYPKGGW